MRNTGFVDRPTAFRRLVRQPIDWVTAGHRLALASRPTAVVPVMGAYHDALFLSFLLLFIVLDRIYYPK